MPIRSASGAGIGRAAALAFAHEGANVLVSDIREADAAETVELIRAAGGTAEYMVADASKEEAAEAMVAKVVELWGVARFRAQQRWDRRSEFGLHRTDWRGMAADFRCQRVRNDVLHEARIEANACARARRDFEHGFAGWAIGQPGPFGLYGD